MKVLRVSQAMARVLLMIVSLMLPPLLLPWVVMLNYKTISQYSREEEYNG